MAPSWPGRAGTVGPPGRAAGCRTCVLLGHLRGDLPADDRGSRRPVRYDSARSQVRAAGAHGIDLQIFDDALVTVETLASARESLEADRVIELRDAPALPGRLAALAGDAQPVTARP